MVKVRLIDSPEITGTADRFNRNEVIVSFDNECAFSSEFISDLEVLINDKWITFKEAFENKDLITDNYNTEFFEPKDEEERERGYRL